MKEILELIENNRSNFSELNLFRFLRNQSINPVKRLAFAPCISPFVMSFGDLNKYVLQQHPTSDKIQEIINQHTAEEHNHWNWFLEDIQALGYDFNINFNSTLKFLWSEETKSARWISYQLYRFIYDADSIQKLVVLEAMEATSSVFFSEISKVAEELYKTKSIKCRYFGEHHLKAEESHSAFMPETDDYINKIFIPQKRKEELATIVNQIFNLFSDLTESFFQYAIKYQDNSFPLNSYCSQSYDYEYIIIGAGPAGLQLGYFLESSNRDYTILESGDSPGTFFKDYPRHRKLISINKRNTGYSDPEINLRWDWNSLLTQDYSKNFTDYSKKYFPSADNLVEYFNDYAKEFSLNIKYGVTVEKISKNQGFVLLDSYGNTYSCKYLVIATGCPKLYIPEISGIELAEKYTDVSVNPEDFENQRVLIIGKGNSAFETADNLIDTAVTIHICSPSPVTMAWKTKYVGHLRAVNNNFLDTYQLKSQNAILDAEILGIRKNRNEYVVNVKYSHANGESEELVYDRIILCTGFRFDDSIFDVTCKPALTINNRYPAQTSEWESTNIQDLYFAGILMHMRDFKKKQSGFIHGFRYNIRTLHRIFEHKHHHAPLPSRKIPLSPQAITDFIIDRVNTSSSLWQQTDFMCDLITVSDDSQEVQYFDELTKDYIHEGYLGRHEHYYTVSLEFGQNVADITDPFAIDRVHKEDAFNSSQSEFIHPVIRRFHKNTLIAEHHVIEDLASEWKEDVHIQPLLKFMTEQLTHSQGIGAHLLEAGLLTSEQLEVALEDQERQATARLGEVIQKRGWVKERTIQFLLNQVNNTLVDHPELNACTQLGNNLVEAGLLTSAQVDEAIQEQKISNKRLGEILVNHGWVNSQTIEYMMKHLSKANATAQPEVAVMN